MTSEEIEQFLTKQKISDGQQVKIVFKKRESINGSFIKAHDYAELKKKNFWRIVTSTRYEEWQLSKSNENARLFNGDEFSRLTLKGIEG
jgi:predicted small secreted protein